MKFPKSVTKFGPKALKAVLVGYTSTGYILWHPSSGKFLESCHVKFNEKLVYGNVYKMQKSIATQLDENLDGKDVEWLVYPTRNLDENKNDHVDINLEEQSKETN